MGKVATYPLPPWGSPPLQSGGENQKWPTCGQGDYLSPAASGVPSASERGAESEVAPLSARWLRNPCRLGGPLRFRAGGQNQKWPTCGQGGYSTPAASGVPSASERGAESEVAHLWARWLRNPCRRGGPLCFRAGGRIRSGACMGNVATYPLPPRGSPPLQSGGQNQKWPTCGQGGYLTPAASGIPLLQSGGQNQKWPTCGQGGYLTPAASWGPLRFRAGGRIRSGPLVGKVAT